MGAGVGTAAYLIDFLPLRVGLGVKAKAVLLPVACRRWNVTAAAKAVGSSWGRLAEVRDDAVLSAEGERERLHARIEKLDLEQSIGDRRRLADHLIEPLVGHRAVALVVNVHSVRAPGGCPSMST